MIFTSNNNIKHQDDTAAWPKEEELLSLEGGETLWVACQVAKEVPGLLSIYCVHFSANQH